MTKNKKLAFVVELDRCIACKGCQVACHMENGTEPGVNRIQVRQIGPTGVFPELEMYFLPVMCQHCEEPACARACPTGALRKNAADGVVLLDADRCVGCRSCLRACPYHAVAFSPARKKADKCTLCAESRTLGEGPACARSCAGSALHWGDLNDPESEVSRLLRAAGEENVYALRDFGNRPAVRYILKNARWHEIFDLEPARSGRKEG